jgi:tetratricopeptide (TPR) repeat protein
LKPQEQAALEKSKVVNPDAYEAYLKGRYFWNKRTGDGLKKAIEYFNRAIETDPNYAEAYSGLAEDLLRRIGLPN